MTESLVNPPKVSIKENLTAPNNTKPHAQTAFTSKFPHHPRLVLLAALLSIAAFFTTIYIYNQNYNLAKQLETTDIKTNPPVQPRRTTNQTQQPLQTYTNIKYGYTISYPSTWESRGLQGHTHADFSLVSNIPLLYLENKQNPDLLIIINGSTQPQNFENSIAKEVTINGYPAISNKTITYGIPRSILTIQNPHNNLYIQIDYDDISQELDQQITQIISSLQFYDFLNTNNWKTYTNQQLGYSVKYPPMLLDRNHCSNEGFLAILRKTIHLDEVDNSATPTPKDCSRDFPYTVEIQTSNRPFEIPQSDQYQAITTDQITIDNQLATLYTSTLLPAYKEDLQSNPNLPLLPEYTQTIIFETDNKYYRFILTDKNLEELFYESISTFQLLSPDSQTVSKVPTTYQECLTWQTAVGETMEITPSSCSYTVTTTIVDECTVPENDSQPSTCTRTILGNQDQDKSTQCQAQGGSGIPSAGAGPYGGTETIPCTLTFTN